MIRKLTIVPPLAIARLGSSPNPSAAFSWSRSPITPSSRSTLGLQAETSIAVAPDGSIAESVPDKLLFKDEQNRFLPVCPFFELWGEWDGDQGPVSGPISKRILEQHGLGLSDVCWSVRLGNLKAYHFTLAEGDRISATASALGNQHASVDLIGGSPAPDPLILPERGLPMGSLQVIKPTLEDSPLRLRITPPAGLVYGPENLKERVDANIEVVRETDNGVLNNEDWRDFDLPSTRKIINPRARWARLNLEEEGPPPVGPGDNRNSPSGLSASLLENRTGEDGITRVVRISMGLVDDVSDGIVTCRIGEISATSRIVVGPPDFAPMNRPIISLQDGLTDREERNSARNTTAISDEDLEALVADIFERALETSDLMNKDAQNDRARITNVNRDTAPRDLPTPRRDFEPRPRDTLWPTIDPRNTNNPAVAIPFSGDAMPVSDRGSRKHRRYNAIEYLRDRLREEPELLEKWIRPPRDASPYYDRRMPALMRGSDGLPIHLTRRQYELIRLWVSRQED